VNNPLILIPIPVGHKGPVLKNWQTRSPESLAELIAKNPGCNKGVRHDSTCVPDPDSKEAGEFCDKLEAEGKLPDTVKWKTAAGNIKRLYRRPPGLDGPITIKELKLQLRTGAGMQDVIPPSHVKDPEKGIDGIYEWIKGHDPDSIPIAVFPAEVLDLFKTLASNGNGTAKSTVQISQEDLLPPDTSPPADYSAYAQAALVKELAKLASQSPDSRNRNIQLNNSAFALGQLVGAGALDRGTVEAALFGTVTANGLPDAEARRTIRSGIEDGILQPRKLPERKPHRPSPEDESPAPTLKRPAPLRFPDEVMTGAAGRFARTYSEYLETPANFLYMAYLTILGHVISDRITLKSEITPQPRLFTVLLGESADVRKSTSISKSYHFFKDTISAEDLNATWGAGSGEGLAKSFKNNNRVILLLDELKAIIQKMRIESSSLLPCINTLFESNIFHNSTKKQNIAIEDGHLCMLAASTLDTYQNMFTGTFTDIGFINRLFIVIGDSERKFSIPEQIPQEIRAELKQDLRNILTIVDEHSNAGPWPYPMNSTARDLFDSWYFQLEPSIFAKRLDAYGHRLMPLLAANEGENIITPETAEKTIALLDYQLKARKLADPIDADSKIARLEETIRRKLAAGPLPKRELERKVNKARMGVWAWDQAIKNLSDDHQVVWDSKNGTYHLVTN
jgi:hypothetical protein